MNDRVDRLRAKLEEPLLVSDPANVRYLSGLASSNAALLVEPRARPALHRLPLRGERPRRRRRRVRRDEARPLPDALASCSRAGSASRRPRSPTSATPACTPAASSRCPTYGLVEELRAVKDEGELDAIRRAAEITDVAFERFADEGDFVGRTETRARLADASSSCTMQALTACRSRSSSPRARMRRSRTPFPAIGASSEARPSSSTAGCMVDGYCSDCTRTLRHRLAPGRAACAPTRSVSTRSSRASRPCARASGPGVDAAARDRIEAAGFGEAFGHGLGHGVGLLVHEDPRLAQESRSTLAAGNVVTVEPGIYLPGLGGIRIEDLVVVRDDGPEILTTFTQGPAHASTRFAGRWPRPSTRTSSRTACTSRSRAASGASSSSSTSSPARAARSCARS